ncbi:MAG: DUF4388 domain-containing protein [Planctomycetes bacterium]|nr:DUF4388 domain-containing protein [Planctomycetota bacterium]
MQHFGLGEVFQTLALNQHTGSLIVQRANDKKIIYFTTGSIALFSSGKNIRIGSLLINEGKITAEQLDAALAEQQRCGKLLGLILIEQGTVSRDDIQAVLRRKVEEELYDLLLWEEGTFEFLPGHAPPELLDPNQQYTELSIDPKAVLMEGLRQLDEWKSIERQLPDQRALFRRIVTSPPPADTPSAAAKALWDKLPRACSVRGALEASHDTRFQTLKELHQLLAKGWLRLLEFDEYPPILKQLRKAEKVGECVELYAYLCESNEHAKNDPAFVAEAGDTLIELQERDRGAALLFQAMQLHAERGARAESWDVGFRLIDCGTPSLDHLMAVWEVRTGANAKQKARVRDTIVERLKRESRFLELAAFLSRSEEDFESRAPLLLLKAEAQRGLGDSTQAIALLEEANALLEESHDLREQIRCARLIFDIDPTRADIRRRMQSLLAIQEEEDKRKQRRFTLVGMAMIGILIAVIPPLRYELKARERFELARLVEAAYADSETLEKPIASYREVAASFAWSTRADLAESEAFRLEALAEKRRADAAEREKHQQQADREARHARQAEALALAEKARVAEEQGRLAEAREHLRLLLHDYTALVELDRVRFPLGIESTPQGAEVFVEGAHLGRTPLVHHYAPGGSFSVELRLKGYRPALRDFEDDGTAKLAIAMERAEAARTQLYAPIHRGIVSFKGYLLVASRDGWIYSFAEDFISTQSARWRFKAGLEGYPGAHIRVFADTLFVTSLSGQVLRLDADNGAKLWSFEDLAPVTTAPAISEDGRWVAFGNEAGTTSVLDASSGERVHTLAGVFPVEVVVFDRSVLRIADRARQLRALRSEDWALVSDVSLPRGIAGAVPGGGLLLDDGTLCLGDERKSLPVPATNVRTTWQGALYASKDRRWVLLNGAESRSGPLPVVAACAPLLVRDGLVVAGRDGNVYGLDTSGTTRWMLAVDGIPIDLCVTASGNLFLFMDSGRALLLEGEAP